MARTVVALYDDFQTASEAVKALVDNGFSRNDISLMATDQTGEYGRYLEVGPRADNSEAAEGAAVGAGVGAVIGGLGGILVGLGALTIPGIGPVIAAGPLAAALTGLAGAGAGAVAGGVTGGLLGALADMGVPDEDANLFAEGVRRGGSLVTLQTDDQMSGRAKDILDRFNPIDIHERASYWRESGWTGYDETSEPFHRTEIAEERIGYGSSYDRTAEALVESELDQDLEPMQEMEAGITSEAMGAHRRFRDFEDYDDRFRLYYDTHLVDSGYTYEQYVPAYRYGYNLAIDERYYDWDWDTLEPNARSRWEERNPGTWERFMSAVRHAWEEVKDALG